MGMEGTAPKGIATHLALVTTFAGSFDSQNKLIGKKEVLLWLLFLGVSLVSGSRDAGCTAKSARPGLDFYVLGGCRASSQLLHSSS